MNHPHQQALGDPHPKETARSWLEEARKQLRESIAKSKEAK